MLLTVAALIVPIPALLPVQSQEDETDASGIDKMRIEQEDKLLVPADLVDDVWEYLHQRLVLDKEFLAELDPAFTSTWSEELFHDTYFDTPAMEMYALQSGLRHRHRQNLTNPDDRKSGRELMQLKLNSISDNELERGEIKFDIEKSRPRTPEDNHPMLGRVERDQRELLTARLAGIGVSPERMRPILTVRDLRRRVYLSKNGAPFMSISHDQASARIWWAKAEFCELEPELNEIGFTEADPATRAYMESVLQRVVDDVLQRFPEIQRDLTPKYNKAFDRIEAELPFARQLVRVGMQSRDMFVAVIGAVAFAIVGVGVGLARLRSRRRRESRKKSALAAAA